MHDDRYIDDLFARGLRIEDGGFVAQHTVENPEARQAQAM
jgi:hypothetical protein